MKDNSTLILNPEIKSQIETNIKSSVQAGNNDEMISAVKAILMKHPQHRVSGQNKVLNKFTNKSQVLTAISSQTSIETAQNIIKQARIYEVFKNRLIVQKGNDIDNIIIVLKGRLGVIDSTESTKQQQKQEAKTYKKIIENCLRICKQLRRKTKQGTQVLSNELKTSKASVYDLVFQKYIDSEQIFNLNSLINCKKYTETLITLNNSILMVVSARSFFQSLASFVRKTKSDKISPFRKFQYFSCIENQKLIQIVDELPVINLKKGQFLYKQGEEAKQIYLLLKGQIKVTKTVDLFLENPNKFYINRQKIKDAAKLPFADFSDLYNYKPRNKILELTKVNEMAIIGEQQLYSTSKIRQANAQISSETASLYVLQLSQLQNSLFDMKNFIPDLKQKLYSNQTQQKIKHRQEILSNLLMCETKNSMDYFFIENNDNEKQAKGDDSPRRYKINKVNQMISPVKTDKKKESPIKQAAYHTFNFDKLLSNSQTNYKKSYPNKSLYHLTEQQSKIIELVHSSKNVENTSLEQLQHQKVRKLRRPRSQNYKELAINIHNPLFNIEYFTKNRKQALRIQKQERMKSISSTLKVNRMKNSIKGL